MPETPTEQHTEQISEPLSPQPDSAFPFASRFIAVNGHNIHYVEQGSGQPVLFIHGCPTSSYLWRNIIPFVSSSQRAIAFDLIAMGQSDKPAQAQDFAANYLILEGLIELLQLDNVTLVLHDWGAALGFEYARNHPDQVKAIAFMEGVLPPMFPQPSYAAMGEEMGELFKAYRDPVQGVELLVNQHVFIEKTLPHFIQRPLAQQAWHKYRAPFINKADRTALLVWPKELPIAGEPASNVQLMANIEQFMGESEHPMLLIYANPGTLIPPQMLPWYQARIQNLTIAYAGQGTHFIQEDQPALIGQAIANWLAAC